MAAAGGLVQMGGLEGAVTIGLVLCADIGIRVRSAAVGMQPKLESNLLSVLFF